MRHQLSSNFSEWESANQPFKIKNLISFIYIKGRDSCVLRLKNPGNDYQSLEWRNSRRPAVHVTLESKETVI